MLPLNAHLDTRQFTLPPGVSKASLRVFGEGEVFENGHFS